jgi:putative transposase
LVLADLPKHFWRSSKLWTDSGYNGHFRTWAAEQLPTWSVEIVKHWWTGSCGRIVLPDVEPLPLPTGFHVLPKRWIVERTFAWLGFYRRLSKDYERLPATSETLIQLAMIHVMTRRLARQKAGQVK